jgi:alpha-D-ribose 1-methylphosphonate 5-triphosphate synthase subunit PhnG
MHSVNDVNNSHPIKNRQKLLSVLSKSSFDDINLFWQSLSIVPSYSLLKAPEVGMAMVRAKTGGTGQTFNMGEMTVTRTVIRLDVSEGHLKESSFKESSLEDKGLEEKYTDIIGFGYTAGRETKKSELIAVIDAYFQLPKYTDLLEEKILQPLLDQQKDQEEMAASKVDATKVNFFTMVRGE